MLSKAAFTGREDELRELQELLNSTLEGEGSTVFVTGEAGWGKTALVEHFVQSVSEDHPSVIQAVGRCKSESQLDGLAPFKEVLLAAFALQRDKLGGGRDQAKGLRQLAQRLTSKRSGRYLYKVAPAWIDIFTGGILDAVKVTVEETRALYRDKAAQVADLVQETVFQQCTKALVELAAESPLIVFIDDLQWIDESSLALLKHLALTIIGEHPIMIIGAYRPSDVKMRQEGTCRFFEQVLFDIRRYGGKDLGQLMQGINVRDYLQARYSKHCFPDDFVDLLDRTTKGYPLFLAHILELWEAEGVLGLEDSIWRVKLPVMDEDRVPDSVQAVIEGALSRLHRELDTLLEFASIEGEYFSEQVVAAAIGLEECFDQLELLEQDHRLVCYEDVQVVGRLQLDYYRFVHALFREHCYTKMKHGQRKLRHLKVGECLETLFRGQCEAIAGRLALHFQAAGEPERAAKYMLMAGRAEAKRCNYREARNYFRQAIDALNSAAQPDVDVRLDSLLELGRLETLLGEWAEAFDHLEQCAKLAVEADKALYEAESYLAQTSILIGKGEFRESSERASKALRLMKDLGNPQGIAAALEKVVLGPYEKGVLEPYMFRALAIDPEVLEECEACLLICQEQGDRMATARIKIVQGRAYYARQDWKVALRAFSESQTLAEDLGDWPLEAETQRWIAQIHGAQGKVTEQIEILRQLRVSSEQSGDKVALAEVSLYLSRALHQACRMEEAIQEIEEAIKVADSLGNYPLKILLLGHQAWSYRCLRKTPLSLEHAAKLYQEQLSLARQVGFIPTQFEALSGLTVTYGALKLYDSAERCAAEAQALAERMIEKGGGDRWTQPHWPAVEDALEFHGNIARKRGAWSEALDKYGQVLDLKKRRASKGGEAGLLNVLAHTYCMMGEYDAALEYHQASQDFVEANAITGELLAQILHMGAVIHNARGEPAPALKKLEKLQELTAEWDLQWVKLYPARTLGVAFIRQGNFAEARRSLESGLQRAEQYEDLNVRGQILASLAECDLAEGRLVEALEAAQHAREFMRSEQALEEGEVFLLLSRICYARKESTEAREWARQARVFYEGYNLPRFVIEAEALLEREATTERL